MSDEAEPGAAEQRTFLIADMRGYTTFTDEHGDEAAAALARDFAELARAAVEGQRGVLLELRGDEALSHFASARQALKAAVDLQRSLAEAKFPRGVGIGIDTGEAVAVLGGFRGTPLNRAARLCAQAPAGHIFATETTIHLAGRIEGVRYADHRTLRLKGFEDPVRVVSVFGADGHPSATKRGPRTGRLGRVDRRAAGVAAALVVVAFGTGTWAMTLSPAAIRPDVSSPPGSIGGRATDAAGSPPDGGAAPSTAQRSPDIALGSADVTSSKGGLAGTGAMPGPGPEGDPILRWQFKADSDMGAAPVITDDTVFAAGADGVLQALDLATGTQRWSIDVGAPITATSLAADSLYATTSDGGLHAIDRETHKERWRVNDVSSGAVPAVVGDTLYVGLASGRFKALTTADRRERWTVEVGGDASRYAIADGTAFISGDGADRLSAVDIAKGKIRWQVTMATSVITPAVLDGTLYVVGVDPGGRSNLVAALDATNGDVRWRFSAPDGAPFQTLAVSERLVYTSADSTSGTTIYAVDRLTGVVAWKLDLADGPIVSPISIVDGRLFVASATGLLHELDATNGSHLWQISIGGPSVGPVAITGGLAIAATRAGPAAPGGLWAIGSVPNSPPSTARVPLKWLADLRAGNRTTAQYTNVAVDAKGNVYSPDRAHDRVAIWDAAGVSTLWGKHGSAHGEFDFSDVTLGVQSASVAIAPDGRIAVGDSGNRRVEIFDAKRRFLTSIPRKGDPGEFVNPCCVAFDQRGRLYVADAGRSDIQVFDRDGGYIRTIGSKGDGDGQFSRLGIPFIDPKTGNVWVPDYTNRRVQVLSPSGDFVAAYGNGQNGNPELADVYGVVLDSGGRMFVVDGPYHVSVLDPSGHTLWTFGPQLPGAGTLVPVFVSLTPDGKLYLTDINLKSSRVVVFQLESPLWPPP